MTIRNEREFEWPRLLLEMEGNISNGLTTKVNERRKGTIKDFYQLSR